MTTPTRRRTLVPAVVLTLVALPVLAQKTTLPIGRSLSHGDEIQQAIARLTVTPEQDAKLKAICETEKHELADLRARVRPAQEALDAAARAENPDAATVGKAYLQLQAAGDAVKAEYAKFHDAVAALLTPEQKAQFESYLRNVADNRARWRPQRSWTPPSRE